MSVLFGESSGSNAIPEHGFYLTKHADWASVYFADPTQYRIGELNTYRVDYTDPVDMEIVDVMADREFDKLGQHIATLAAKGYQALQTVIDSEILVIFPGVSISRVE